MIDAIVTAATIFCSLLLFLLLSVTAEVIADSLRRKRGCPWKRK